MNQMRQVQLSARVEASVPLHCELAQQKRVYRVLATALRHKPFCMENPKTAPRDRRGGRSELRRGRGEAELCLYNIEAPPVDCPPALQSLHPPALSPFYMTSSAHLSSQQGAAVHEFLHEFLLKS
ncbi:hypothetical protein INR49_026571 [Caranx melampygus]|nr:hypothetical protein INR49_026571 [Caranx melampygus]